MNPKRPQPSAFGHPVMDPNIVFSPINSVSGNPHLSMPSDVTLMNQNQAPAFVPIAVPVPTAGPSPMWYMTPTGMVPFSQMGHHQGYFVPLQHSPMSSAVSENDMSEVEEARPVRRSSRPSTPTKSNERDLESKRCTTSSEKSRIPRPSWRHRSSSTPTNVTQDALSNREEKGTSSNNSNPYRPNTPPIRLRSSSEQDREPRRPRGDSFTSRPEERIPRSASPRLERSRPSSPSLSGGNSGSRPSSPVGSRSSSPVSLLISKFEELSDAKASESAHSVSNLLNKFGSSSLLSEDRITRKHFRTTSTQGSRTGPLRPSSAMEHGSSLSVDTTQGLSRSWSGQTTDQADKSYESNDSIHSNPERNRHASNMASSPLTKDETNKSFSMTGQARSRLISSLEDLYESLKEMDNNSDSRPLRRLNRNWNSMENIYRENQNNVSNSIRKSTSEENLTSLKKDRSTENRNVSFEGRRSPRTIYSEFGKQKPRLHENSSESQRKAESPYLRNDETLDNVSKRSNISDLFRKLDRNNEVDRLRDYNLEHPQRLEIPVALAVMDGERESRGSFGPALFSPTALKDGFFQHPVKLEKDPPPLSPPAPLSPSVKDFKPTNYFSNLSFSPQEMKPERDTGLVVHSDKQNNLTEKPSITDSNQKRIPQKVDSIDHQPAEGDTEEAKSSRSKTRHSSSSGSSSGRYSERRGSNSSKVSSGYHSDYLDRHERKPTRTCSTNSEEDSENSGKAHWSFSNPKNDINNNMSPEIGTNTRKEKEGSSKPMLLSAPLKSANSSLSTNVSTTATQTPKTKPSSVPSTPTERNSGSSTTTYNAKTSRGSASVPSTPNSESKSKPFFKYVSPNSSLKKSSSRPPSSEPSPNGNQRSVKENRFDFSERTLQDKVTDLKTSATRNFPPISLERGSTTPGRKSSSEFKSVTSPVPIEIRKTMSPTEPRSPASPVSSSSSASSPSPRFPNNKFLFYSPQNELVREHFSPTEQINNLGQKRYVITDTSRQKNNTKHKVKESRDIQSHGNPTVGKSEVIKSEIKSEIKEPLLREHKEDQSLGHAPDQKGLSQSVDLNKIVLRKTISNPEGKLEQKPTETKILKKSAPFIPKTATPNTQKDVQERRAPSPTLRRGSIDLREIYHQARRSSLSILSLESQGATAGRPKSISPQRPPSPGRVDSRELLGHFVKKVLNSTKSSNPNSPRIDPKETSPTSSSVKASQSNEPSSDTTTSRKSSRERKPEKPPKEEVLRKTSRDKTSSVEKRRTSGESQQNGQRQTASVENAEQSRAAATYKRHSSHERKSKEKIEINQKRNSLDKKQMVVQEKVVVQAEQPTSAVDVVGTDKSKDRRRTVCKYNSKILKYIGTKNELIKHDDIME